MVQKEYTFDIAIGDGLKRALKEIKEFDKAAGNVELSPEAVKQINELTTRIQDLEKKMEKLTKGKLDAKNFRDYSKAMQGYIDGITQSFSDLFDKLDKFKDGASVAQSNLIGKLKTADSNVKSLAQSTTKELNRIDKAIEKSSGIKGPKIDSKATSTLKEQNKETQDIIDSTEKLHESRKKNVEVLKEENELLEKNKKLQEESYDVDRDIKKPSKKGRKAKQTNTALKEEIAEVKETVAEFTDAEGNKIPINVVIPEGTDVKLKDTIAHIVNSINETNPTIRVGVRFASDYNTRQKREAMEHIEEELQKAMNFAPNGKKAKEQYAELIQNLRGDLLKALRHDDSDAMFQFSTNVVEIGDQIRETIKSVSEAIGSMPLNADVVLDEEQVQAQLKAMKDLTITVSSLDFSESFLKSLDATSKLIEKQKELKEAKKETAEATAEEQKTEEEQKIDSLIAKAKKVKELAVKISDEIEAIELKGKFDKDQIQDALNQLMGLSLRIDELDVANIKGTNITGGVVGGAVGNVVYTTGGTGIPQTVVVNAQEQKSEEDKTEAVEKSTDTNNEATESVKQLDAEMAQFVQEIDSMAKSLKFNKDQTSLSQALQDKGAVYDFIKKFKGSKHGLLDWALNTTLLGDGETFKKNLDFLEKAQEQVAKANNIKSPSELLQNKDFFKYTKNGLLAKRGNDESLNTLFASMILYGANRDSAHSVSQMLAPLGNPQAINQVAAKFYEANPSYQNARYAVAIPTTPEKKPSKKKVLADDIDSTSKVIDDELRILNDDIKIYLDLTHKPLDALDKSLKERLEEVSDITGFLNLSKDYKEQKETKEQRGDLGASVFHRISSMSPQKLASLDSEKYPVVTGFIDALQTQHPDMWEKISHRRNVEIEEEIRRRFKRIDKNNGQFLQNEKLEQSMDYFMDAFYEAFPTLSSGGGEGSFQEKMTSMFDIATKDLKALQKGYDERKDTARLEAMPLDERIKTLAKRIKLDDKGEVKETAKSKQNLDNIFNTMLNENPQISLEELEQTLNDYEIPSSIINKVKSRYEDFHKMADEAIDKKVGEAEEKASKEVRAKTQTEISKSIKEREKAQTPETPVRKAVEGVESINSQYGLIQNLVQRANVPVDKGYLGENSEEDIQQILSKYYARLVDIEKLSEQINYLREKIRQETGQESSDEEILSQVFPESPESVKNALSTLKQYDEYYAEANRLVTKSRELSKAKKTVKEDNVDERILDFNENQIKSLNDITQQLSVTKTGAIGSSKKNQEQIKKFSQEVYDVLQKIQAEEIESQTQELRKQESEVSAQLKEIDTKMLEKEKKSIEEEQTRLEENIKTSQNRTAQLQKQADSANEQLKKLDANASKEEKNRLKSERDRIEKELRISKAQGTAYENRYGLLADKKSSIDQQLSRYNILSARQKDIKKQLSNVQVSPLFFTQDSLRNKIGVPGIEQFNQQAQELRAESRQLGEEFDKLSLQMKQVGEGTAEYTALEGKRNEINQKINENNQKVEQLKTARGAYEDSFYQSLEKSYYDQMKAVGVEAPKGYIEGVKEEEDEVEKSVEEVIKAGIEAARKAQDSHSPSKEYYRLGMWAVEGYLEGIKTILPLLKEVTSQIKINPSGTITDPKSIALANDFIDKLKTEWGVSRIARKSPFEDLLDDKGNVVSKGLKSLYSELPRTPKTGQIQKGNINQFKDFFDSFTDAYGLSFNKNGQLKVSTFKTKMKQMGVGEKDLNILVDRFTLYAEDRVKKLENERARLKTITDNLGRNSDGKTINKQQRVNGDSFNKLFRGYISNYKNAYNKNGIVDETFQSFAKDMGLSEDNAQRIKDVFSKIFTQMWGDIDKTRQQCVDAVNQIGNVATDTLSDADSTEEKNIEDNKARTLESIEEERKAREAAIEAERKERQNLIEDLEKIQKNTTLFTEGYRERASQAIDELRRGGDLGIGRDLISEKKDRTNRIFAKSEEEYYNILGGVNRLLGNKNINSGLRREVEEFASALRQLDPAAEMSQQQIGDLRVELKRLEAEADKAGRTFLNVVVERLQKANADFFARYFSIRDIIRYFRTFTQTITEYDTALTEMRKVSDESVASLKEYQKATFDVGTALGTTALQIQQSTADWLRLGESMEEASESARVATMLFNVSEFENVNEATEALVAMSQAYKDMDKTEIIDVLNNIGNNYSIATDQLATALQASSAALMTQGNDLYEAAALVTAGNAIIQDASKTGTGIRTIALRIAGQKMDKEELEKELNELGEEVDEWVMQTEAKKRQVILEYTKVASNDYKGVDILDPNGNLKDTYHIMLEISKIYKEIQEEDKKYGTNRAQGLVEELAGKVRSNIAASILNNPEMLENVYVSAMNSMGSAAEENAKYLDSIAGKTAQLKNEWQEFQTLILNSDLLKDLLDMAKFALDLINKLIDNIPELTTVVIALGSAILAMSQDVFFANGNMSKIQLVWSGLTSYLRQFTKAQNEATVATELGTAAIEAQTKANIAAAVASKAKNALLAVAITAVVALLAKAIKHMVTYRKELERAANESRDRIKEIKSDLQNNIKTVDELGDKYAELSQRVGNLGQLNQSQGSLSNDEYKEFLDISNQLSEVFPTLTQGYDDNGNAILSLNGSVETITQSLQELLQTEKDIAAQEILENAGNIFKDDAKKYDKALKQSQKSTAKYETESGIYEAILNNRTEGLDYNDVNRVFSEIFGDATYLEGSVLDKYTKDWEYGAKSGLDFSTLDEKDRKAIEQHFSTLRYDYLKEQQGFENDFKQINSDLHTYLNTYASTVIDDDTTKSLVSGIINSLDYANLTESQQKDWSTLSKWLQEDIIDAVEAIDDEELTNTMSDVLNNASLSAGQKVNIIENILSQLTEHGLDEGDPIVVYWTTEYEEAKKSHEGVIDALLGGMESPTYTYNPHLAGSANNAIRDEEIAKRRRQAEEWAARLTADQINTLMSKGTHVGQFDSFNDILDYLNQVEKEIRDIGSFGALLSSSGLAGNSTTWQQVKDDLVGLAKAGKLDEDTLKEYEWYDKIVEELGLSADEADNALTGMVNTINSMAQQNAVDVLKAYKDGIDNLDDAYQKFKNQEFIDASTLSGIQDAFGDLDSYKAFEEAVMSGEKNLQQYFDDIVTEYAIQNTALSELTAENKEWVKQQLIASGITKESAERSVEAALKNKEAIEGELRATLELMNAEVQEKAGRDDLVVSTENLDKLTAEEIVLLMQEAKVTGTAAQAVAAFYLKKELAKDSSLRNQDDINYLLQLINLAGIGGRKIAELKYKLENQQNYENLRKQAEARQKEFEQIYGADHNKWDYGIWKSYQEVQNLWDSADAALQSINTLSADAVAEIDKDFSDLDYTADIDFDYGGAVDSAKEAGSAAAQAFKDSLDKILAMYDAELDAGVITFQTYVDKSRAIIEQYYKAGKITAQEYYDELADFYGKQVSQYDKVISAVQKKLSDETDALEKEKENIEKSYNEQIEVIQKKIDALQDENDEIDRNMELSKAQ